MINRFALFVLALSVILSYYGCSKSAPEKLTILFLLNPMGTPCQNMQNVLGSLLQSYPDNFEVIELDIRQEQNQVYLVQHHLRYVPAFIIKNENGDIIDVKAGILKKEDFLSYLEEEPVSR